MRKIKAEDVIVEENGFMFGSKIEKSLAEVLKDIKKEPIYTSDIKMPQRVLYSYWCGSLGEKVLDDTDISWTLDEKLNSISDKISKLESLKKSIDLILQELKLNPDEWEYKTEKKLVKTTSMTASEFCKRFLVLKRNYKEYFRQIRKN